MKFTNSAKVSQGPNFKTLDSKEVKIPDVLENKKYITKREGGENGEKKERGEKKSNAPRRQKENNESEDSSDNDEDGFTKVKSDKPKKR